MRKYRNLFVFLLTVILIVGSVPTAFASRYDGRLVTVNAERGVSIEFDLRYDRDEPSVRVERVTDHNLFRTHRELVEILDITLDSNAGVRSATVTITRDRRSYYVYNSRRELVGTTSGSHEFSSRFFLTTAPIDLGGRPDADPGQTATTPPPPPPPPAAAVPAPVIPTTGLTAANAQSMVQQAIQAAAPGANPNVRLVNPGDVSLAFMRAAVNAAQGRNIAIHADTLVAATNNVDVRIRLYPALVTADLNLSGSTSSYAAAAIRAQFERHFTPTVSVVSLGQQGSFGFDVNIAARVAVPADFNLQNLHFYSFNRTANTVRRFTPTNVAVDTNGFLHFTTSQAGDILITTSPLVRR